jgi:hypothetical protein
MNLIKINKDKLPADFFQMRNYSNKRALPAKINFPVGIQ